MGTYVSRMAMLCRATESLSMLMDGGGQIKWWMFVLPPGEIASSMCLIVCVGRIH